MTGSSANAPLDERLTVVPAAGAGEGAAGGAAGGAGRGAGDARPAVLVLPGGGYERQADHEAEPVAAWLAGLGLHAVVLRYRVAPHRHPAPLDDARAALRRLRAGDLGVAADPRAVGVLGFSAGGHLAATLSTLGDDDRAVGGDGGDGDDGDDDNGGGGVSARPDFAVLCYPVISLEDETHEGSVAALLGPDATPEARRALSADRLVTAATAPTFLWHTADDEAVPVTNALRYASALHRAGVPASLHVYPHGRHGLGLAAGEPGAGRWTAECAAWLRERGIAPAPPDRG
ncbi:alpha/beta hydrolase [Puerhibacterium sp. TATVAM-FAB25]|uniref:alpha/beta hydrolase n=1 Tax=Puerhibacterium sp. TATVAM-FAB25 TaxID=3093699 RepID=UPI00397CF681